VFCLEVLIYKRLQMWRHRPQWISNFYMVRIYRSLGIFTVIFVKIYTSVMEIWQKMCVGVFFWTQCTSRKYPKLLDIITLSYPWLLIIISHLVHSRSSSIAVLSLVILSFIAAHWICTLICASFNLCFAFGQARVLPFCSINRLFISLSRDN